MRQQTFEGPRRQYTTAGYVIWLVRPRPELHAEILHPCEDIPDPYLRSVEVQPYSAPVKTPKTAKYWAKKAGIALALLPLKLVYLLFVGYTPTHKKPKIVLV